MVKFEFDFSAATVGEVLEIMVCAQTISEADRPAAAMLDYFELIQPFYQGEGDLLDQPFDMFPLIMSDCAAAVTREFPAERFT